MCIFAFKKIILNELNMKKLCIALIASALCVSTSLAQQFKTDSLNVCCKQKVEAKACQKAADCKKQCPNKREFKRGEGKKSLTPRRVMRGDSTKRCMRIDTCQMKKAVRSQKVRLQSKTK